MSSELVFPGDEVAIEEEYMGGEGTFSEDGTVYASQVGVLELDDEECIARVVSPNPPNVLKEGDIVYAVVADIRNTMATADVIAKEGTERNLGGETYATIHVSKISPKYTDDVSKELRKGDMIRARVTVMTVPPIVMFTLLCRARPYLLTMGYATRVWDAYMLASRMEDVREKSRSDMLLHIPKAIGMANVSIPKTRPLTLFLRKSSKSISRPARNMI